VTSRVAVIGLGLMGGSLARALKRLDEPPFVLGSDLTAGRGDLARAAGAVDELCERPLDAVATADVVVYATPLPVTLDLLGQHLEGFRPDALVTDVASLKGPIKERIVALGLSAQWVGAHPMGGAEQSGFEASRADLYAGARVWLTAAVGDHPMGPRSEALWRSVGGVPAWTDADAHDARMASVSHLPQLLANALAAALAEEGLLRGDLGPGGLDMTRLAGSSPDLWLPLLEASAHRLAPALRELAGSLDDLADVLDSHDLSAVQTFMARTRAWKEHDEWG